MLNIEVRRRRANRIYDPCPRRVDKQPVRAVCDACLRSTGDRSRRTVELTAL